MVIFLAMGVVVIMFIIYVIFMIVIHIIGFVLTKKNEKKKNPLKGPTRVACMPFDGKRYAMDDPNLHVIDTKNTGKKRK